MRASTIASLSFAAFAAANPSNGPPNEDITLTVGADSSLEGYQLVGFVDGASAFPAFVTAAEAAESPSSTFSLFYVDYGHFGWYSLNVDVNGATYGFDVKPEAGTFEGPMILISSDEYGSNIWGPTNASPAFPWTGELSNRIPDLLVSGLKLIFVDPSTGDSRDFPFACTNDDGHIQLAIYTPGTQPKNCEQIQLEYKAVA
ncbi:hypothetical protein GGR55DRAFT_684339 [Xylaria sp. FL0064]|nr:hypothetical protein GGR55DRAFT_684339 [Xylaria sp. FL0064]